MRVTRLLIENFKGFGQAVEIPLAPVTLLFGPNSAGKSSILQAASYLHAILCERSLNPSSTRLGAGAMDLGGFKQIIHRGDLNNVLRLGLKISVDEDLAETDAGLNWQACEAQFADPKRDIDSLGVTGFLSGIEDIDLDLSIAWSRQLGRPVVRDCILHVNDEWLWKTSCTSDASRKEWRSFNTKHPLIDGAEFLTLLFKTLQPMYQDMDNNMMLVGLPRAFDALPDWHQAYVTSDVLDEEESPIEYRVIWKALSQLLLHAPLEMLEKAIDRAVYVGPLRAIPTRHHSPVYDRESWADGLAAWDRLFYERALLKKVNGWLESSDGKGLRSGYQLQVDRYREVDERQELWAMLHSANPTEHRGLIIEALESSIANDRLRLLDVKRDVLVYPQDVGVGVSQMVPVMVAALDDAVSLAFIEQPELHIHPRLQLELGDLLLDSAKHANKTLVLETHSEHLILRQLRRIEEGAYPPDFLSVLYVKIDDGQSLVDQLEVTSEGDFEKDWPDGFFDERDRELLA